MPSAAWRRATSLLLALLFIGVGFGAPTADGFLDHGIHSVQPAPIHVESRANPRCHAERCLIEAAVTAAVTAVVETPARVATATPAPRTAAPTPEVIPPARFEQAFPQQPRAPPLPV